MSILKHRINKIILKNVGLFTATYQELVIADIGEPHAISTLSEPLEGQYIEFREKSGNDLTINFAKQLEGKDSITINNQNIKVVFDSKTNQWYQIDKGFSEQTTSISFI